MLFPFGNVGFLVLTLNLRDFTSFNVDCYCRISPSEYTSAANAISTDTSAFRKEKCHFCFKAENKPASDKLKIIYCLLLLLMLRYFKFTIVNVVAVNTFCERFVFSSITLILLW
jgi:transposase-like protein